MKMSARVINPVMLTELYKMSSPNMMRRNAPNGRKLNTIKKDLFGAPNPNETKRIFEDALEKHQDMACKKWGFDFRNGYPIVGNSQFLWERVTFDDFVPEMYTLTRAAHVHEVPTLEQNEYDLLVDERAAKENSYVEEDSAGEEQIIYNVPIEHSMIKTGVRTSLRKKRQPKITEYMRSRKRLASTSASKKLSPIKRMRPTLMQSPSPSPYRNAKCNLFAEARFQGTRCHNKK